MQLTPAACSNEDTASPRVSLGENMTQGSTDASHVTAASPAPAPDVGCRVDKGDFHLISIQGTRQHHLIAA